MPDNLNIFGKTYTNATGIKASNTSDVELTLVRPQGTKTITQNGTGIDVASYASVDVSVSGTAPTLQDKSVTPTESVQTVTADSGYDGLNEVEVGAISSSYVGSGVTRRSSTDLTASGDTVSVPSGYYASNASKSVSSGTEGTPTASKGTVSNHAVSVTPSVTNTAGYISGGTHTGTAVSVSASELVSGTLNVSGSGTIDVTNYASISVPGGSATTPATTIDVDPEITVDEYGIVYATNSGYQAVTPSIGIGYVSQGTAGTITVTGNSIYPLTPKSATTYNTSSTDQTIAAQQYLIGVQTIKAVTTSGISAANIKAGTVVKVGDANDDDRITSVTGTFTSDANATASDIVSGKSGYVNGSKVDGSLVIQHYYTGSSAPSSATGVNGDIYLQT